MTFDVFERSALRTTTPFPGRAKLFIKCKNRSSNHAKICSV